VNTKVRLFTDAYLDSVVQLSGTRAMRQAEGVDWAAAAMATAANLDALKREGFRPEDWEGARANDLFIAVRAESQAALDDAIVAGEQAMFGARASRSGSDPAKRPPRTLTEALRRAPDSNVAVISVPGDYAALEAHKALSAGLDVLLFSDNVPLTAEVELKQRAERLGHFMMGPGAGTAMLGGIGLGFANVTGAEATHDASGCVGVVAAAGTGAQEAMSLLDRWGVGVSHVIGLGGRDLSHAVGGRMARMALGVLAEDERTEAILLVSKPPAPEVARTVLQAVAGKPLVAALIGLRSPIDVPAEVVLASTLETGVVAALQAMGRPAPDTAGGLAAQVAAAIDNVAEQRTLIRGLFSGGTLCYESLAILSRLLGRHGARPVYSNTPLDSEHGLPAPQGSHLCLDLGEEEYTRGRPHPMIDPESRIEQLQRHGGDPDVAAIILDVVLGYGAHADPAAELAPVCAEITAHGGPRVVTYVLGTHGDPQGFAAQRQTLKDAGCIVTETAARASLAAAAIALRNPSLAETAL
jgi:FdrA protein